MSEIETFESQSLIIVENSPCIKLKTLLPQKPCRKAMSPCRDVLFLSREKQGALRSGAIAASTVASRSSSQCVGVAFRSLLT